MLYHRLLVHIVTYCTKFYRHLYCYSTVLCFTAIVTLLLGLNDEFDGIWTSRGLRSRFRHGYGNFGFYDHSNIMTKMVWSQGGHDHSDIMTKMVWSQNGHDRLDIMTKMVWSQGGHIKRRLLYSFPIKLHHGYILYDII